jgi:hypothetical protein
MEEKKESLYDAFYAKDNNMDGSSGVEHLIVNQQVVGSIPTRPSNENNAVTYALNQVAVLGYFNEKFPKSQWRIQYLWNPFSMDYACFLLTKKEQKVWNPFSDSEGTAKSLRANLKREFPDFQFKEEFFDGRDYDQEFLLQFLISIGYEYSVDRRLRELMNPFTKEIIIVHYDENNEPYLLVDGKKIYRKGR